MDIINIFNLNRDNFLRFISDCNLSTFKQIYNRCSEMDQISKILTVTIYCKRLDLLIYMCENGLDIHGLYPIDNNLIGIIAEDQFIIDNNG